MNLSRAYAGVIGPALLALAAGLFINRDLLPAMFARAAGDYAFLLLTGLLVLITGLAIVRTHNIWSGDWRVLITVFGWLAIVAGLVRILFPGRLIPTVSAVIAESAVGPVVAGLVMLAGAFLTYQSFFNRD